MFAATSQVRREGGRVLEQRVRDRNIFLGRGPGWIGSEHLGVIAIDELASVGVEQPDANDAVLGDHRVHVPVDGRVALQEVGLRLDLWDRVDEPLVQVHLVLWHTGLLLRGSSHWTGSAAGHERPEGGHVNDDLAGGDHPVADGQVLGDLHSRFAVDRRVELKRMLGPPAR